MKAWLVGAGLCFLFFGLPAPARAVQTLLENIGMWTTLDAKVAATNFCQ
jgi:hypothetical protein